MSRCFLLRWNAVISARPYVDWSIVEQLSAKPDTDIYRLDEIGVIQPVLVAIAIAYSALLRSLGVEPAAVVGHSMKKSLPRASLVSSTSTRRCASSAVAARSCNARAAKARWR